ncbi:fibronectin type III domain-containing protein [Neobacillus sp. 19]|uniref:fibronectin type III domain-containing protein n=1 Tax=Neobacillus sp. 19 TaxID=3394458 RepID=UPI003BF750DF
MAGYKLPKIVLSIGLGASLLTPATAFAQEPAHDFTQAKIQFEQKLMQSKAGENQLKTEDNGEEAVEAVYVTDYKFTEDSVWISWMYDYRSPMISYQILLNGNQVATLPANPNEEENVYSIKNLEPNTTYSITIKVLKNGVWTNEETTFEFTTYEAPSGGVVTLKDANLAEAIKDQLGIENRGLYESDLDHLTELYAYDQGISSISGLEKAENLEILDLSNDPISDIRPLAGLKHIYYLDLSGTEVKDIETLLTLESLETVFFYYSPINFSKGSSARKVADQLVSKGVEVVYSLLAEDKKIVSNKAFGLAWNDFSEIKPDYYKVYYGERFSDVEGSEVKTTSKNVFLTGLKPDTDYVAFVVSYTNGEEPEELNVLPVYFHTSTKAAITGWVQLGDSWYHYTAGTDKLTKGWLKSGPSWYFMKNNGEMATGWVYTGGKWYFLNPNGDMKTGWVFTGGKWYFLDTSGAMKTGWVKTGDTWYFMNNNGAMLTGWVKSGSSWYYMNQSGEMATGWVYTGGKWYYLKSDGSMAYNTYIGKYKLGKDGAWIH